MRIIKQISPLLIATILLFFIGCNLSSNKPEKEKLIIFHAGSLAIPMKQISAKFMEIHPEIEILREAGGSRTCARKISDLHKDCDLMISADYKVIDNLLIPNYASWSLPFASNEMVLVVDKNFQKERNMDSENWHQILLEDDCKFGRADPNADPCGYRTVMLFQLSGILKNEPNLSENLTKKDRNMIRPKAVDLLALLEAKVVDCIFEYRSVAEQHKLNYISFCDSVNLSNPKLKDFYKKAIVEVSGKKPGEKINLYGAPIIYGLTIPKESKNRSAALSFTQFLLNEKEGLRILEENGQRSLIPSETEYYNSLPTILKQFADNTQEN